MGYWYCFHMLTQALQQRMNVCIVCVVYSVPLFAVVFDPRPVVWRSWLEMFICLELLNGS